MKKQFTLLLTKFSLKLTLTAFTLFFIFNSCKKELYDGEKIDPVRKKEMLGYKNGPKVEIIDLAQFKNKANLNALGTLKQQFVAVSPSKNVMSIATPETYLGFKIITDSIKVIKDKGHTMYVFPVVLASKRAVSFQNLTIDESSAGTVAFVNTYTPTKKWIAEWEKGHPGKFEGDVSVTYLKLNNGSTNPTGSSVKNNQTGVSATQNPSEIAVMICTTTTYYYELPYMCGSGQHYPWDNGCYLEGDDRAGWVYFSYNQTTCEEQNPGTGGTTPNPPPNYDPCPTTPPVVYSKKQFGNKISVVPPTECDSAVVDCAGVSGGSAYEADCGCIGGTTGISECPPGDIVDTDLNDCMKNVLNNLKGLNGSINGIIVTNFDANGAKHNWTLVSGTISDPTILASTTGYSKTTNNVTTTIDDSKFASGSDLAIAKNILHEAVHAYLVKYFATDAANANKEYHVLLEEFNKEKQPTLNDAHHNAMVVTFKDQIASSLHEYGNSRGYTFASSLEATRFYSDLAWGGLYETRAFKALSDIEKNRIKDVIQVEQTGKDVNGNTKTKKGVAGGC